jgi:hypothetical protein
MQRRSFFGAIAAAIGLGSVKATEAKEVAGRYVYMVKYDNGVFMGAETFWPPFFDLNKDAIKMRYLDRLRQGRIPYGRSARLYVATKDEARSLGCNV